jgi:ATP-dependent RNA helicase RhlE
MSLVCVDEHGLLRDIERLLKREIPKDVIDGFEPDPGIRAEPINKGRGAQQSAGRPAGRKKTAARNGKATATSFRDKSNSRGRSGQSRNRNQNRQQNRSRAA